ncbi:MAG: hypothetical protein ACE5OZ_10290 [Candidatus Heimdallarchaeota archaeon]
MTSERKDRSTQDGQSSPLPSTPLPRYALGYCTICSDRDPQMASLAPAAKRLVCAPCFREYEEPHPCARCNRKVYAGDWMVPEPTTEETSLKDQTATADSPGFPQEFFFCDPCLEHHWPACLQIVERLRIGEAILPPPNQDIDPLQLLQSAVLDDFRCPGCNALIEPDFDTCGGCGATNPLQRLGMI